MRILAVIFLGFFVVHTSAQDKVDSTISLKRHPFFDQLISREGKLYSIPVNSGMEVLNLENELLKSLGFEFLKLPDKQLYLHFLRSGKLYKMQEPLPTDSILKFKRIDDTWNYNYNIGSFLFSLGNEIYEIGGYGFWKSNGVLRKFSRSDKEWDVIVLNKEVFPNDINRGGTTTWVDSTEKYLYVPFQRITNDGLMDQGDEKNIMLEAYRLNFSNSQWEFLGNMPEEVFKIFRNSSIVFSSAKGLLLAYTSRLYFVDFTNNSIKVYENPSLAQSLSRLNNSFIHYYFNHWVYWFNPNNQRYDSIYVDSTKFISTDMSVWEKGWSTWEVAGGFTVFFLAAGAFWGWIFFNRRKSKRQTLLTPAAITTENPFTETELSLLLLLAEKTRKGQTALIADINYVLGIKDKNPGMQKKVRSDVINNVNEKYKLLNRGQGQLVQSVRSESDKRYFEYLINAELLPELEKLIR